MDRYKERLKSGNEATLFAITFFVVYFIIYFLLNAILKLLAMTGMQNVPDLTITFGKGKVGSGLEIFNSIIIGIITLSVMTIYSLIKKSNPQKSRYPEIGLWIKTNYPGQFQEGMTKEMVKMQLEMVYKEQSSKVGEKRLKGFKTLIDDQRYADLVKVKEKTRA